MSTADRREREKEKRRNDIIDVAEKLIFSRGYENITMDDIARETELARGTLYLYFKNKDDIYTAIAIRASKILNQMFRDCCLNGKTGIEKTDSLLRAFYEFNKKYPGYYAAYYYSGMFDDEASPDLAELRRIRMESFDIVVDSIREGIREGIIREDVDAMMSTLVMLFSMNSVLSLTPVINAYMKKYSLNQDQLFNYTKDIMLRSLKSSS